MDHIPTKESNEPVLSDTSVPIAQNEIVQIRESIQETQYFDHTSMAALTPASLVSNYIDLKHTIS